MGGFTCVVLLLVAFPWMFSHARDQFCKPLQYIEYRSKGILTCTFEAEFQALFWYDYHDATTVNPVLIFDEYGKSGSGYESGEYDMYFNGSLIINEVLMSHDRNFTVVVRYSQTVKSSTIEVVVTVSPEQSYPVIANCESGQNCFITMMYQEDIVCLVREAKPATKLEWYSGSSRQDNIIPTTMTISKGVLGYVTKAIATYQLPQSYTLKLFMCKAHAIPSLLGSQQSQMLVEFNTNSFSPPETSDIFVKLFSNYTMKCTETNALYIVWKQMMPNSEFENVAYATFSSDVVSQLYSTDFHLEKDGSLTVLQMSDRHKTLFCCVFGEVEYEDVASYALNLYELPVPPFPVIDGCQSHLGCRIVAEAAGNLTCKVQGVRPKVDLKWVVVGNSEVSNTFFKSHHLEAKEIGNKFDVIVNSQYQLKQSGLQTVTLECRCNRSDIEALTLVATVELYFPDGASTWTLPVWIIVPVIGVIILVVVIAVLLLVKRSRTEDKRHKVEGTPTLTTKSSTTLEAKPAVKPPVREKPSSKEEKEPFLQVNTSGTIDDENQPNSENGKNLQTDQKLNTGKTSEKSQKLFVKGDRGDTELAKWLKNIQNGSMNVELKNVEMKSGIMDLPMKFEKNKTDMCFDIPGGYDLNEKTVGSLIRCSLLVDGVKKLSFHHCYMPYKFTSKDLLQAALKDKKITVFWVPRFKTVNEDMLDETNNPLNLYVLNTDCQWEEMETQTTLGEVHYETMKQRWKAFEKRKKTEIKDSS